MLKVPPDLRRSPAPAPPAAAAAAAVAQPVPVADDIAATRAVPRAQGAPTPLQPATQGVSRWVRLLLWIVAVPLGFMIVFGVGRGVGVFTGTQLEDIFLATGWHRFVPLVRLLPFVALVIAGIVQGGVALLMRSRQRRGPRRGLATGKPAAATTAQLGGRNSKSASAVSSSMSARRGGAARSTGG